VLCLGALYQCVGDRLVLFRAGTPFGSDKHSTVSLVPKEAYFALLGVRNPSTTESVVGTSSARAVVGLAKSDADTGTCHRIRGAATANYCTAPPNVISSFRPPINPATSGLICDDPCPYIFLILGKSGAVTVKKIRKLFDIMFCVTERLLSLTGL
jgi:hypothetical protein